MEKYDVELLPAAYSDLDEIFDYIMADNPQAAAEVLEHIMSSLARLEHFPYSGKPLFDRSLSEKPQCPDPKGSKHRRRTK